MAVEFVPFDRDTLPLFPPSVEDYLPAHPLARFVVDSDEQLDLRRLTAVYAGTGFNLYHLAMLVARSSLCNV